MSITLIPDRDGINKFKVPLTKGEESLLKKLEELFESDSYKNRTMEVFVQPNLFMGKPDFVIVEKNSSVWIIEVKDYNPNSYKVEKNERNDSWKLSKNNQKIPSPFQQVKSYKNDLMSFVDPTLENLKNNYTNSDFNKNKYNLLFRTGVYFSEYLNDDISMLKSNLNLEENLKMYNFNYILNREDTLDDFFERIYSKKYKLTNDQHIKLHSILNSGEAGKNRPLPDFDDSNYKDACISIQGRRKIRGAAGSGKTTVLAKRVADCATNRFKAQEKILVVTYNITICNYVTDKITAEGGKNLNELGVTVRHFHSLYKWKEVGGGFEIKCKKEDDYYDAIFIDEGQDFEEAWFRRLINDYLNKDNLESEYVIFADEVQNIYNRLQEETNIDGRKTTLPVTPVPGNWRTLKGNFRMENPNINQIAYEFGNEFLAKESLYSEEIIEYNQLSINTDISETPARYKKSTIDQNVEDVRMFVYHLIINRGAAINDIAILSGSKKLLRELEYELRTKTIGNNIFVHTSKTFVTKEDIEQDLLGDRSYKLSFFRNSGPIKFSTVHSFKGWEAKYVILILHDPNENESRNENYEEIYYVGITRAVNELIIINNNEDFHKFFTGLTENVQVLK